MNISGINGSNQAALSLERVLNLPKEIFQAQNDLNEKLVKLSVTQSLSGTKDKSDGHILDTLA